MNDASSTSTSTITITGDLAADDPRGLLASAVGTARQIVAVVRPDQLALPTPCTDFDVRGLLGHLVVVLRRLAAVGRGDGPMTVALECEDIADDGWAAAYLAEAHRVQEAWTDPATLDRDVVFPWATLTGRQVLGQYTNETVVHTWDLASAIGATPEWDPAVVDATFAVAQILLRPTGREVPLPNGLVMPFAPIVPVADGASVLDRLIAWNGRDPHWSR